VCIIHARTPRTRVRRVMAKGTGADRQYPVSVGLSSNYNHRVVHMYIYTHVYLAVRTCFAAVIIIVVTHRSSCGRRTRRVGRVKIIDGSRTRDKHGFLHTRILLSRKSRAKDAGPVQNSSVRIGIVWPRVIVAAAAAAFVSVPEHFPTRARHFPRCRKGRSGFLSSVLR